MTSPTSSRSRSKGTKRTTNGAPSRSAPLDRFDLYERCAQNPERDARFLRAVHGGSPRTLGEDFCGTGALSRAWVAQGPEFSACAVDHDPRPLKRLGAPERIRVIRGDVRKATARADVIAVFNFSIGECRDRKTLVAYLAHARRRLARRGCFVADIYGGSDAYMTGRSTQRLKGPGGSRIAYTWEQRAADPLTGMVVNAMHFEVTPRTGASRALEDAFVYHWRLWSIAELRDAMADAGFRKSEVFPRFAGAIDTDGDLYVLPVEDPADLGDSYAAYVVGRV